MDGSVDALEPSGRQVGVLARFPRGAHTKNPGGPSGRPGSFESRKTRPLVAVCSATGGRRAGRPGIQSICRLRKVGTSRSSLRLVKLGP